MTNTTATGGYLLPDPTVGTEDDFLEDVLGDVVAGICDLPRNMVSPRWQPEPPAWPDPSVNWCAVGVTQSVGDWGATEEHYGEGDGHSIVTRHETLVVVASFYGPNSFSKATMLRDGLQLSQNRDELSVAGMSVTEAIDIVTAPVLLSEKWTRRYDLTLRLRRAIRRTYPVLNLLSAQGMFRTGSYTQNFEVTET